MFIHIGNGNVIQSEDIVAIIDCNLLSSSTITEEMMIAAKQKKKVIGPKKDAKALMITKDFIYFSTLSVSTLKKRSSIISTINKLDDYSEELT
ncbi:extracellular matrix regulator RemB [Oceanobacillus massiliensis]|uniref:extracellular matrix regulator RemB n=1 Tax=Oceanobacillus massiliensis TaxID=1465765 RepID=UPI0002891CB5|nr:extracellular matrix/biofilm biosynthesis regulator RemA family protein [Oceanobacillus massiliensis]